MKSGLAYSFVAASLLVASPASAFSIVDLGTPTSAVLGMAPTSTNPAVLDVGPYTDNLVTDERRSPYDTIPGLAGSEYYAIGQASQSGGNLQEANYDVSGSFLEILWGSPDETGNPGTDIKPGDDSRQWIEFTTSTGSVIVTAQEVIAATAPSPPSDGVGFANIRITGIDFESFKLVHVGPSAYEWAGVATPLPAAAWFVLTALAGMGVYYRRYGRPAQLAAA